MTMSTSGGRTMLLALTVGIGLTGVQPAASQARKPAPQGPVKAVQPSVPTDWLPDLVIVSAEATATCAPNGTVNATVVATVKNEGTKGTADLSKLPFHTVLEVSSWWPTSGNDNLEKLPAPMVKPQAGGPPTLKPGQSWQGKLSIAGMPKFKKKPTNAPQYGFVVRADPSKAVAEANEANNEKFAFVLDPCAKP